MGFPTAGFGTKPPQGVQTVLTADRTLMSEYNGSEFMGFAACSAKMMPDWLYKRILCPSVEVDNGGVKFAPCGLRKIESALLDNGFSEKDVVVAHPEHLNRVIGKETKVLGISTNDPLGLGPASTTFADLMGRESYNAIFFRLLVSNPLIRKYGLRVIVGGAGAWQLNDERIMTRMGIDTVCIGEGELVAPELFSKALNGEKLPRVVEGGIVPAEQIPTIIHGTINGLVEIARGCGRGCKFCNPTMVKYRCYPLDKILKEVKVNLNAGCRKIILHAEDVLRYNANGVIPNGCDVIELFTEVKKLTDNVGMSHFGLASVAAKPELIEKLSEILELGTRERPWTSAQTGIETGSPGLATEHLKGKAKPFDVKSWPSLVRDSFGILKDNNWVPCATLILGMPKENSDDVIKTIELVEDLSEYKSFIVPLFFIPIGTLGADRFFRVKDMTPEHWKLLAACIKHDFRWLRPLMEELFIMDDIHGVKATAIRFFARYAKKKLDSYVKAMEQGENPLSGGGSEQ